MEWSVCGHSEINECCCGEIEGILKQRSAGAFVGILKQIVLVCVISSLEIAASLERGCSMEEISSYAAYLHKPDLLLRLPKACH